MIGDIFGWSDLRKQIAPEDLGLVCPVEGCKTRLVERQTAKFRADPRFGCPDHGIIFSPSTFEYGAAAANILWDVNLLNDHMRSKRESRIARDNSEDAVTWNVFHFLEQKGLLLPYLSDLAKMELHSAKVIFWSHDRDTAAPWEPLMKARREFELRPDKGSEPDLIVLTERCLFIIEAKLTSGNKTVPGSPRSREKYIAGGDAWWNTAFAPGTDYALIAEQEEKYELTRFWLLGTWMAKQLGVDFRLVNLLRDQAKSEQDIEERFRKHLPEALKEKFLRRTWEGIYGFIGAQAPQSADKDKILRYFEEKTVGYRNGLLQKAFAV